MGLWGAALGVRISRFPIPPSLRESVYRRVYGGKYDAIDESELEKPFSEYRSINELFTRGLRPERRPLANNADRCFTAPCDGTVQMVGRISHETVMTAKEIPYQLSSLAPKTDIGCFTNGRFVVLFLSPRDCHRVFSPQNGTLEAVTHVPGYRLLVHPPYQRAEFPVFTLNERLIMEFRTELGRCLVIMIAGWGVGHITHPFVTGLVPHGRQITYQALNPSRLIASGDWIATFELGSTVILITEPHDLDGTPLAPVVQCGQGLHYGESVLEPVDGTAEQQEGLLQ